MEAPRHTKLSADRVCYYAVCIFRRVEVFDSDFTADQNYCITVLPVGITVRPGVCTKVQNNLVVRMRSS